MMEKVYWFLAMLILQQYVEKFPDDMILVSLNQNKGQANARNIGIHHATAQYFTFLDADDWVDIDIYEKMLEPADRYQCDLIQCFKVDHIEGIMPYYEEKRQSTEFYEIHNAQDRKNFFRDSNLEGMIGTSIFRTEWIKKNQFEFKSFAKYEDNYWFGLIAFSFQSYYLLPEYLYHYRILKVSNSHSRNDKKHFERLNVEIEKIKYFQENGLFDIYYEEIRNQFLKLFYINTLHIIFCQFDYIPLKLIQSMQLTVKDIFPDYLEYYKESKNYINSVLTVAFDFPLNGWEDYKKAYLEWGAEKKEEGIVQFYVGMRKALGLDIEN